MLLARYCSAKGMLEVIDYRKIDIKSKAKE